MSTLKLIDVKNLTFSYFDQTVLKNINFEIESGQRCLIIGLNGAGKSTLLRLLAGKHMVKANCLFSVLGSRAPQDQINGLAYLGNSWSRTVAFAGNNVAYQCDIKVREMMTKLQEKNKERRDYLVNLLGINLDWKMHQVSDGQRKRVQIMLGLLNPFKLLLMDEITVDLDIIARQDLLRFLKKECQENNASVVYATHIFDGLDDWVTHIIHLSNGESKVKENILEYSNFSLLKSKNMNNCLLRSVETKLREEYEKQKTKEVTEIEKKEKNKTKYGPQGGYSSGRFYNYWK